MPYKIYVNQKTGQRYARGTGTGHLWALTPLDGRHPVGHAQSAAYWNTSLHQGVRGGTVEDAHGTVFAPDAVYTGEYKFREDIPEGALQPAWVPTGFNPTPAVDGNPKDIEGRKKAPLHLIPATAQVHLSRAFADGVQKYGQANWREKGVNASVYVAAAQRHLALWYDGGEEFAEDSKVHHLGHAMACLAIILDAQQCGKLNDDRPEAVAGLADLLKNPEHK